MRNHNPFNSQADTNLIELLLKLQMLEEIGTRYGGREADVIFLDELLADVTQNNHLRGQPKIAILEDYRHHPLFARARRGFSANDGFTATVIPINKEQK